MADLGFNAYRFGVEWARIEPEEGYFSRAELDHYRRMCATCVEHGITPVVTYNHFSFPRWFSRDGGFEGPQAADQFARYSDAGHRAPRRPRAVGLHDQRGEPHRDADGRRASRRLRPVTTPTGLVAPVDGPRSWPSPRLDAMTAAHRKAFDAIKSVRDDIQVGWSLALVDMQAAPGGEERLAEMRTGRAARLARRLARRRLGRRCRPTRASSSAPTACCRRPRVRRPRRPGGRSTPRRSSTRCGSRRSGPVGRCMVTENGLATDRRRRAARVHRRCAQRSRSARSPTGSTCAGTCTGRCSTTSNGRRASRSRSA